MRKKRKRKPPSQRRTDKELRGRHREAPEAQHCHQLTDLPPLHPDRGTFLKAAGVHLQPGEWGRAGVGCVWFKQLNYRVKNAQNSRDHLLHHRPDATSILGLVRVKRKSTEGKSDEECEWMQRKRRLWWRGGEGQSGQECLRQRSLKDDYALQAKRRETPQECTEARAKRLGKSRDWVSWTMTGSFRGTKIQTEY